MTNFSSFVNTIVSILDPLSVLLVAVAMAVFFYGIIEYIRSAGDTGAKTRGREMMMWGIIALVVLTFVWYFAGVVSNSLFGKNGVPTSGTAQQTIPVQFGSY
ncbi:MAG TPA: hypothetical protein VF803_02640 [Candidatus Paceibacterota bacterium]